MAKHLPGISTKQQRNLRGRGSVTQKGAQAIEELRKQFGRDPTFQELEEFAQGGATKGKFDGNTGIEPVLIPGAGKGASPLGRTEAKAPLTGRGPREPTRPVPDERASRRRLGPEQAPRGPREEARPGVAQPAVSGTRPPEKAKDPRTITDEGQVLGEGGEGDRRLALESFLKVTQEFAGGRRGITVGGRPRPAAR